MARMLDTLCRITEKCHAGPAGKNAESLNGDLNALTAVPLMPLDYVFAQVVNSNLGAVPSRLRLRKQCNVRLPVS